MTLGTLRASEPRRRSLHIVRRRWDVHADKAGYDPLFDQRAFASSFNVSFSDFSSVAASLSPFRRHAARLLKSLALGRYQRAQSVIAEASQRYAWARSAPDVIHIGAVDELIGVLPNLRRLFPGTITVGTVHLPPNSWRKHPRRLWAPLGALDALIVLSSEQQDFFSRELPTTRSIFVPHGVDTDFFRPSQNRLPSADARCHVIFAGSHMRDLDVLAKVVAAVVRASPICFDLVLPLSSRTRALCELAQHFSTQVVWHDQISFSALLALYQRADVALLPLLDGSANNSVLEALACGVPVITTDLGGTKDYVSRECGFLVSSHRPDAYVESLFNLSQNPALQVCMSKAARTRAEQISWEKISQRTIQVYADLYVRGSPSRAGSSVPTKAVKMSLSSPSNAPS
jgi:glycosyltransferase involved in cell wall biosynthesis